MVVARAATLACCLLWSSFSHGDTPVAEPKLAGPTKELLESAHQVMYRRECHTDPAALQGATRTPPRSPASGLSPPTYPPAARAAGREGTTALLMLVNEEGWVVRALVERSSGHRDLDQAALDVAGKWKFIPAQVDNKPHCSWGRFAITFKPGGPQDPGLPVFPEAERLLDKMFDPTRYAHALADTKLLRGTDADELATEVAKVLAADDKMVQRKRNWAGMWSARLSRQELEQILAFYETPAGQKWLYAYRDFERRATGDVADFLGVSACNTLLAQRALARGKTERGITADGIPEEFIAALPGLVQRNEAFCECAAQRFRQSLESADATARDTLIDPSKGEGKCRPPAATGW